MSFDSLDVPAAQDIVGGEIDGSAAGGQETIDEDDDDDREDGDDEGTNASMAEEEDDDEDDDEEDGDDATTSADAGAGGADDDVPAAESTEDTGGDGSPEEGGEDGTALGAGGVIWVKAVPTLDRMHGLREIGREAICWQLSSAKPGNGVEQIRDGSVETYWQSDGNAQPHWIQVSFGRRVAISHVCLYLDFTLDESYTPRRAQVQVGMTNQDLISAIYPPMAQVEFQEPTGWCIIPLSSPPDPLDDVYHATSTSTKQGKVVRTHLIRISILSMHQNGRDTHVRQVQLYGPRLANYPTTTTTTGSSSAMRGSSSSSQSFSPPMSSFRGMSLHSLSSSQFSTIR